MPQIVTLTMNPAVDKAADVPNVMPEAKMRCDPPTYEPGGGGINVTRAIKKLGGESTAYYTSGGPTGHLLADLLREEDLQVRPLPIDGLTRENFTAFEESSGREYRFGMPGPEVSEAEWQNALDVLGELDANYIVASGSLPRGVPVDFYARVAAAGKEIGAQVIVDTSGEALQLAVREGLALIKPNIRELELLVGEDIESDEEAEDYAKQMLSAGAGTVVLSMGAGGAMLVTDGHVEQIRAPTVKIRSRIGAGDSMVAGIVLSLARGWALPQAARYGVAAGAAAVMTPGTGLCRLDDTEALYARISGE